MITRSGNRTILWALGLSCLLHAALLLAAPSPVRSHHVRQPVQQPKPIPVRFVEPEPLPDPEPQEREIDLGLDAPAPPSNTWLGFLEYIKQIAMHSEVEQAAFTDDPIAASPPPPLPAPEPDTPPVEATTPDDPHEQPADIKPDPTPQSADADVENLQPQPHQRQEQPQPEPALIERPVIEREQARSSRPLQQMLEELRTRAAAMMAQAEAVEHTQATPPPSFRSTLNRRRQLRLAALSVCRTPALAVIESRTPVPSWMCHASTGNSASRWRHRVSTSGRAGPR